MTDFIRKEFSSPLDKTELEMLWQQFDPIPTVLIILIMRCILTRMRNDLVNDSCCGNRLSLWSYHGCLYHACKEQFVFLRGSFHICFMIE